MLIFNFVLYVYIQNLLAETKCVDIILHCQHHNHASYIKLINFSIGFSFCFGL